jgi:flavin-dependent dehydrogenase
VTPSWDVAVVGGGFSGTILACTLARKGYRVVILERGKQVGQETRSGNLAGHEWWRAVGAAPPACVVPVVRRETAWLGPDYLLKRSRDGAAGELFAFRREDMDAVLAEAALEAGVARRENFDVEEVEGRPSGPATLRSADRTETASVAVVACGADEQVLVRSRLLRLRPHRSVLFMCQQRLRLAEASRRRDDGATVIEFRNVPGLRDAVGYALFMAGEAYVTVTGVVPASVLADGTFDPRAVIQGLKVHPVLDPLVGGARVLDWRTRVMGAYPAAPRRLYGDRVLVIGDAARPLGGSVRLGGGFSWAAGTAREAASLLTRSLERPSRLYLRPYAERLTASDARWRFLQARLVRGLAGGVLRILARTRT